MTAHDHTTHVVGCFRCDLSREEEMVAEAKERLTAAERSDLIHAIEECRDNWLTVGYAHVVEVVERTLAARSAPDETVRRNKAEALREAADNADEYLTTHGVSLREWLHERADRVARQESGR